MGSTRPPAGSPRPEERAGEPGDDLGAWRYFVISEARRDALPVRGATSAVWAFFVQLCWLARTAGAGGPWNVMSAQRHGVKFGRKPKLCGQKIDHARKLIKEGESRQYVADPPKRGPCHAV